MTSTTVAQIANSAVSYKDVLFLTWKDEINSENNKKNEDCTLQIFIIRPK